jgi:hypothetical protein
MEVNELNSFMSGAVMMGCVGAGIFFLKFWSKTQDRFFAIFAFAFFLLAFERWLFVFIQATNEAHTWVFIVRLLAFLLILTAVIDKNRA